MADPLNRFSCLLDVGTPANAARAFNIYVALSEDDTRAVPLASAFRLSLEPEHGASHLWIRDDDGGDPAVVVDFVLLCARTFGLTGLWGFSHARTSPVPEPDGFAGGAHLLDLGAGRVVRLLDAAEWLAGHLSEGGDANA